MMTSEQFEALTAEEAGINVSEYPIDDLSSPAARELVSRLRAESRDGVISLSRFLAPEALQRAQSEARAAGPAAFEVDTMHNVYQTPSDPRFPPGHVRNRLLRTRVANVAFDQMKPTDEIRRLYAWRGFAPFISALTGSPMFPLADPLGCCNITYTKPGWEQAWHLDESEFSVTLGIEPAESGGSFECTPPLRSDGDDLAAEAIAHVIALDPAHAAVEPARKLPVPVKSKPPVAGGLKVFNGSNILHRVAPVAGARDRIVGVFCFASEPGVVNSPEIQRAFWGRTADAAADAGQFGSGYSTPPTTGR
jgi:hypothetical protein